MGRLNSSFVCKWFEVIDRKVNFMMLTVDYKPASKAKGTNSLELRFEAKPHFSWEFRILSMHQFPSTFLLLRALAHN